MARARVRAVPPLPATAVGPYAMNIGAAVAYEAARELKIQNGVRDTVPWEFLDNHHRAEVLARMERLKAIPLGENEIEDIESALMRRIITFLS